MPGRDCRALTALFAIVLAAAPSSTRAAAWFSSVDVATSADGNAIVELYRTPDGARVLAAARDNTLYEVTAGAGGGVRLTRLPVPRPQRLPVHENMLPDGELSRGAGAVREAFLTDPTTRYGHGVLGDAVEAGGVAFVLANGNRHYFRLGPESVFEDRKVRLADIDGDGVEEGIVVRSYLDRGAALAIVEIDFPKSYVLAETPPIGRPNRWLNPVGAADLDGDGAVEIAFVRTPHIGGVLEIHRYADERLEKVAERSGFSNHRIGSRALGLSLVLDADGDGLEDVVAPDQSRTTLVALSFAGGRLTEIGRATLPAEIAGDIVPFDLDGNGRPDLCFPLADGAVAVVLR
jgi:hypothetical protein